jgi:hypothetical protein
VSPSSVLGEGDTFRRLIRQAVSAALVSIAFGIALVEGDNPTANPYERTYVRTYARNAIGELLSLLTYILGRFLQLIRRRRS